MDVHNVETRPSNIKAIKSRDTKPDFLFPGSGCYAVPDFTKEQLRIHGAKTTCKGQVLAEADGIDKKHLNTLEPVISEAQTFADVRDEFAAGSSAECAGNISAVTNSTLAIIKTLH